MPLAVGSVPTPEELPGGIGLDIDPVDGRKAAAEQREHDPQAAAEVEARAAGSVREQSGHGGQSPPEDPSRQRKPFQVRRPGLFVQAVAADRWRKTCRATARRPRPI